MHYGSRRSTAPQCEQHLKFDFKHVAGVVRSSESADGMGLCGIVRAHHGCLKNNMKSLMQKSVFGREILCSTRYPANAHASQQIVQHEVQAIAVAWAMKGSWRGCLLSAGRNHEKE